MTGKTKRKRTVTCPHCGAQATHYYVYTIKGRKYIYLVHYSSKDRGYHRWSYGPLTPEAEAKLESLGIRRGAQKVVLEGEDVELLRKVVEQREDLKKILAPILTARRVQILFYQ